MKKNAITNQEPKNSIPKAKAPRKPKVSVEGKTQGKRSNKKAEKISLSEEAASSFMRASAFTLQSKIRSSISQMPSGNASASVHMDQLNEAEFLSSEQPNSSGLQYPRSRRLVKIVVAITLLIGLGFYLSFSGLISQGSQVYSHLFSSWFADKAWVEGMLTQQNGIPENNDKPGTLLPPKEAAEPAMEIANPSSNMPVSSDILPVEPSVPLKKVSSPKAEKKSAVIKKVKSTAKTAKNKNKSKNKGHNQ